MQDNDKKPQISETRDPDILNSRQEKLGKQKLGLSLSFLTLLGFLAAAICAFIFLDPDARLLFGAILAIAFCLQMAFNS